MGELKVTVVIATKNRKEDLQRALTSCLAQTMKPEIIVMDDGSTDGTMEMVRKEFPTVTLYRYATSSGPAAQRNRGVESSMGDIIVAMDDDAEFVSPRTIEQTLADFESPIIGAVAIPFINVKQNNQVLQRAPDRHGVYLTDAFVAAACAIRRDVFLRVGKFRECIVQYGEEEDLCIRLLNAGFITRLGNAEPIHHYESPKRVLRRMDILGARNKVLFSWFNTPMPYVLIHLPGVIINRIIFGFKVNRPSNALVGIALGISQIAKHFKERSPVGRETYRLFRRLRQVNELRTTKGEAPKAIIRKQTRLEDVPSEWMKKRQERLYGCPVDCLNPTIFTPPGSR